MLKRAWYAICLSTEISDVPERFQICNQPIVVFRTEGGRLTAVQANCPHRGCAFELGRVEGNHLVCAYHGWKFDFFGQCTHIPANADDWPIPKHFRAKSYPCQECGGLVWVYGQPLGDASDNRPGNSIDIPSGESPDGALDAIGLPCAVPEVLSSEWLHVHFHARWHAHLTRVVESVLDVSHLPFVHPETTGSDVSPRVRQLSVKRTTDGLVIHPSAFAPAHPLETRPPGESPSGETEIQLWFPNQWIIRTPIGLNNSMCTFLTFTPIDGLNTDIFGIALRDFDIDDSFLDDFHLDHTRYVMEQDRRIVESQSPVEAPLDLKVELHVPSDVPTARYRAMYARAVKSELGERA